MTKPELFWEVVLWILALIFLKQYCTLTVMAAVGFGIQVRAVAVSVSFRVQFYITECKLLFCIYGVLFLRDILTPSVVRGKS